MKTIEVFVLFDCTDPDYDQIKKLTTNASEAHEFSMQRFHHVQVHELNIPQEFEVQRDY